ncbi:MAG: sodium/solute symporter [Pirellulales bacterium]|nr:sodium/solute symporter [Pirellulales bacterium]
MNLQISTFDLCIVLAYLVGIVGLGCYAGMVRRRGGGGEGGHYFLAGNTLGWPVIGLAMFAANISTVHLVSLAQNAYTSGLLYGNYEWMAGFVLILLSLFFAPLYLRTRVSTLPDYLERRYNRNCRDVLSFVSLISAIVIHIGVALYTASTVLCYITGIPETQSILGINALMFFIIAMGALTGVYTLIGGLLAVVWTESLQTVLLLLGAVCITVAGYVAVGGWDAMSNLLATHPHPLLGSKEGGPALSTASFLHMMHPANDDTVIGNIPWYSMMLGYPVIGIWYFCCDQTVVQRVLAAKDEKNARLGPLFCAFIKILPVFLFVLPGIICVALVQKGYFTETVNNVTKTVAPPTSKDVYPFMIAHLLPVGLMGLVTAAMLAAAMQTCSAALNSAATLFAYDIWKRWRPNTRDHRLVQIGRWTTAVATVVAIVLSPIFGHYETIFQGLQVLICYIAPPITAVFLVGVFWKKAGGRAAFLTMVVGAAIGAVGFTLSFFKDWIVLFFYPEAIEPAAVAEFMKSDSALGFIASAPLLNAIYNYAVQDFMLTSFCIFTFCVAFQIVASLWIAEPLKEEARPLVWEDWREPLRGDPHGRGLGNYRIFAAAVAVVFVFLYYVFW